MTRNPIQTGTGMRDGVRSIPPELLERVAANAAGVRAVDGLGADVERLRARGRSTVLEYRFEGGLRLIAKRYERRGDAATSYEVLRALRAEGFGPGSPYRVPEPLGCFADWGVLLMGAAPGHRLPTLAAQPGAWEEGLRGAARWLARLHAVSVDLGGPRQDITQGVFRLARRAARAAAQQPGVEGLLVRLIEELAERAESVARSQSQAQTHGRYHAGHVFVAPETVTVVDLDRVALADPAVDVGEFLHRVRAQARRARLSEDAADRAALTFLEEYVAHAHAVPGGLAYYWSYSVLSKLLRVVELDQAKWEKRLQFYRAEFDSIPRRVGTLRQLVR
jgi:hypothetical protein